MNENNAAPINYPFLAGYLESALRMICFDTAFTKLNNAHDRDAYVDKVIAAANAAAKEFAEKHPE